MLAIDECRYIIADPIGRVDSGISSYSQNAVKELVKIGVNAQVISKESNELIDDYRGRLATYIRSTNKSGARVIVEAPETEAATMEISGKDATIHIRLHCSKNLGALVQGQALCQKTLALEQTEIARASYLSAPSASAVIASRALFRIADNICCYPNPAPEWSKNTKHPDDSVKLEYVLFVGRLHPLKGVHWLYELVARLPEIQFHVITPLSDNISQKIGPSNLIYIDGANIDKFEKYRMARLVLIPSIYETASMVGIEAIAAGVPIVSWAHLGISEYGTYPDVVTVKPWQIDMFSDSVRKVFFSNDRDRCRVGKGNEINKLFLDGFKAAMDGKIGNFMPVNISNEAVSVTNKLTSDKTTTALILPKPKPMSRWHQKLRKLRRTPLLFFKDSWLIRSLATSPKSDSPEQQAAINKKNIKLPTKPAQSSAPQKQSTETKKPIMFTKIQKAGKIEFRDDVPSVPAGLITGFLYPDNRSTEAGRIISELAKFSDFRYVQPPMLQIGTFQTQLEGSVVETVERIDVKNKKIISSVDHLVLLDPPLELIQALRSAGTRQRTIVILTKQESLPDPWHVDVLIVVDNSVLVDYEHKNSYRRVIRVKEPSVLHVAIRRAIQEGAPKNPDMFLPLFGFDGNYRDELLSINSVFFQGLIRMPSSFSPRGKTIEDLCFQIANNAEALAVTESVYLKYRSLCDRIDDKGALARLLSFCIYDGVIFDVRI